MIVMLVRRKLRTNVQNSNICISQNFVQTIFIVSVMDKNFLELTDSIYKNV